SYPAYAYQAYPAAPGPAYPSYPDPGDPHPAYPAGHSRRVRLEDPFIPNGRVASPLVATAAPAGPAFHPFRPAAASAPAPVPAPRRDRPARAGVRPARRLHSLVPVARREGPGPLAFPGPWRRADPATTRSARLPGLPAPLP